MPAASRSSRSRALLLAVGVALAGWLVLASTAPRLPLVWDEAGYWLRAEGVTRWLRRAFDLPDRGGRPQRRSWDAFSERAIEAHWPFAVVLEGHPAGFALPIALGLLASGPGDDPLRAARAGPMLLFSLGLFALAYRLARERSPFVAAVACVSLLAMPRVFAHAHFASQDAQLTACWLISWAAFAPALRSRVGALFWGACLGLTFSMKFTGWIAAAPFVAWVVWFGDRRAWRALGLGLPMALLTFIALDPPLWREPLSGLWDHFALNLSRASRPETRQTGYFLGELYGLERRLPWYNALLLTVLTVPTGLLLLAGAGAWRALRRPLDPFLVLVLGSWAVLPLVRALPGAPPHDGVRLFLPSFGFLAILAGEGAGALLARTRAPARRALAAGAVVLLLLGSASSVAWYFPQCLSYYNLLAGGLRGAAALGMEPTYWWDGLDDEVLAWLNARTGPGDKVAIASIPYANLFLLHKWRRLEVPASPELPGVDRWYVIQNRPSQLSALDVELLRRARPAFQKTIRPPGTGLGPWRLDVPLVWVFAAAERDAAARRLAGGAAPRTRQLSP